MHRRELLKTLGLGVPALPMLAGANFPTTVADRVDRLFKTPGPHPNGMQATRDGLWILDQQTNRVSLCEFRSGRVKHEIDTEADRGSGLTFDGTSLWVASTYNRKLIKVDAETGATLAEFNSPGSGVVMWGNPNPDAQPTGGHGVEWRDGQLFLAIPPAASIYVVKSSDGSVIHSFPSPGIRPHGVAWDPDGSLWCADSIYRSFFKLDPAGGRIIKQHMLPFTQPQVGGRVVVPHGATIWLRYIYFCVAETGEVYRTPLVNRMS